MADEVRSLRERLTEYRVGLLSMARQVEALLASMPPAKDRSQEDARVGLQAAVDVYRIVAGDLSKVLDGEELHKFAIVLEVPNA